MIRLGKDQGWLRNDTADFHAWAEINGASIHGLKFDTIANASRFGTIAVRPIFGPKALLMSVPRDMILSLDRVGDLVQSDPCLRELFTAVGDFGNSARGATMLFLLFSMTSSYLQQKGVRLGRQNLFTDYVKYLPEELLPTMWTDSEKALLLGTTLLPAVEAKLRRLRHEYDTIRDSTKTIEWCQSHWWGELTGQLTFWDWLQLDAMYRSRAVKFPPTSTGIDCMIPCIDMLNHAETAIPTAYYDIDNDGSALLWVQKDGSVNEGFEVTINYGISRTACEMLYSYGFIDTIMMSAKGVFLDIEIPSDDPLGIQKCSISTIRGVRLRESSGHITWDSDFVWLLCVNGEDGLRILPPDGNCEEPRMVWKGCDITDTSNIRHLLELDFQMWNVYQLRAATLIQERIKSQLKSLRQSEVGDTPHGHGTVIRQYCWDLSLRLRDLELKLLIKAEREMNRIIRDLLASHSVQRFLNFQKV